MMKLLDTKEHRNGNENGEQYRRRHSKGFGRAEVQWEEV